MSESDQVSGGDGPASTDFLFINVKEENVEDEQLEEEGVEDEQLEEEGVEEREDYDSPQEVSLQTMKEDDIEDSPAHRVNHELEIDKEGTCTSDGLENADVNPGNINQAFSCKKCSISFVSPVFLEGHKNRCRAAREDEHSQTTLTGDARTQSNSCDSNAPKPRRVKSRVPRGELKHKCDICGRGFVRLSYLKAHEAAHTTIFKCNMCSYTTDQRKHLSRHLVVHYGKEEKIYACPHCSYTAGKSSYLRKHVAKHAEEKMFRCNICSYETAVSCNLTTHMMTHNGQKPFACSHCYYSTLRKAQLAKHLQKYHSTQNQTSTN